jgi:hypothetical protein
MLKQRQRVSGLGFVVELEAVELRRILVEVVDCSTLTLRLLL